MHYLFIHSFFHPLILSIATQLSQVYIIYSFILFFHPLILSIAAQLSQVYFIYSFIFFSSFDPFLSCSAFPGILYLFNHSFNHPLSAQLSQVNFFILFIHSSSQSSFNTFFSCPAFSGYSLFILSFFSCSAFSVILHSSFHSFIDPFILHS